MPRAHGSAPPEAIRIEDEVWEQAFTRREPASDIRRRRLRAIDGGQADWLSDSPREWLSELHDDWRDDAPRARPVRAAEPATASSFAEARETEMRAATWLGGSPAPRAESSVAISPRFQIASGGPAEAATRARAETAASAHGETVPPARRTIKIQGRGAERNLPLPDATRRRPQQRPYERAGFRPDRLAMWAVILGFLLVFVAVVSGHG
jgi:hypothetical protein